MYACMYICMYMSVASRRQIADHSLSLSLSLSSLSPSLFYSRSLSIYMSVASRGQIRLHTYICIYIYI